MPHDGLKSDLSGEPEIGGKALTFSISLIEKTRLNLKFSPLTFYQFMCIKIKMEYGVASHQLPVKYPQLPAHLIGFIMTLIWRIYIPHFSLRVLSWAPTNVTEMRVWVTGHLNVH